VKIREDLSENETALPYPVVSGKEGPHKTKKESEGAL
jgi:hypothetical protein